MPRRVSARVPGAAGHGEDAHDSAPAERHPARRAAGLGRHWRGGASGAHPDVHCRGPGPPMAQGVALAGRRALLPARPGLISPKSALLVSHQQARLQRSCLG